MIRCSCLPALSVIQAETESENTSDETVSNLCLGHDKSPLAIISVDLHCEDLLVYSFLDIIFDLKTNASEIF